MRTGEAHGNIILAAADRSKPTLWQVARLQQTGNRVNQSSSPGIFPVGQRQRNNNEGCCSREIVDEW